VNPSRPQLEPELRANSLAAPPSGTPAPIPNCPECSLWLPEGTLLCPDCQHLTYTTHLHHLAEEAAQREQAYEWASARATWQQALAWLPAGTSQAEAVQAHIAQIDARTRAAEDTKARWTKRLGPFAPIAFFLLKAKTFLFAILKFKFIFSFLAFFGVYWALFGWRFGLGFTLGILIHEIGHYVAARRRGLKADLPLFIPGLGAYVRWYHQGVGVETLAAIALAGPLFGLFVACACLGIASRIASPLFLALAYSAAFLNLFNLVPVLGLDGAQATYSLNRLQRFLIVVTCVLLYALLREWVFLAIAAGMAWRAFTGVAPEQPSSRGMVVYTLLLFALGAILWAAPDATRSGYGMYPR
jgi:Zn-dependent protease/uncharacterized Zn finger protein (UPF0148 family)